MYLRMYPLWFNRDVASTYWGYNTAEILTEYSKGLTKDQEKDKDSQGH